MAYSKKETNPSGRTILAIIGGLCIASAVVRAAVLIRERRQQQQRFGVSHLREDEYDGLL